MYGVYGIYGGWWKGLGVFWFDVGLRDGWMDGLGWDGGWGLGV